MPSVAETLERINERLYDLDARVRALERKADDDRVLEDIQSSISMLADSIQEHPSSAAAAASDNRNGRTASTASTASTARADIADSGSVATALTDPRFRAI
nr:hypothetical protein TetV2_00530 [Oceanusvirus sp.]